MSVQEKQPLIRFIALVLSAKDRRITYEIFDFQNIGDIPETLTESHAETQARCTEAVKET